MGRRFLTVGPISLSSLVSSLWDCLPLADVFHLCIVIVNTCFTIPHSDLSSFVLLPFDFVLSFYSDFASCCSSCVLVSWIFLVSFSDIYIQGIWQALLSKASDNKYICHKKETTPYCCHIANLVALFLDFTDFGYWLYFIKAHLLACVSCIWVPVKNCKICESVNVA